MTLLSVLAIGCVGTDRGTLSPSGATVQLGALPPKADIVWMMRRVNEHRIATHPDPGANDWERATYFEGNIGAYNIYPDERYLDYAVRWGERNEWSLIGGVGTRHADNLCAGQTYIDLYRIDPQPDRIAIVEATLQAEDVPFRVEVRW